MGTPAIITRMAVISSITPVKQTMPSPRIFTGQRIIAGFGVLVCCGMLMLAVPRFIAGLYALYPEAAFNQTGKVIPPAVYEKCIADLNRALSWYKNPDYYQAQGFFYLSLFNVSPLLPLEKKQELLKQGQTAIIQGLTLSPIDPYGWFRLAAVDSLLKLPRSQSVNALRLSFYAGRVEPELVIPRLAFSYEYYNDFDEDMQRLWQNQVRVAWTFKPGQLVNFVALHPEAKQFVEKAFVNAPDDWKKFLKTLESYPKKTV